MLFKNGKPYTSVCSVHTDAYKNTLATTDGYAPGSDTYIVSNSILLINTANTATNPKACTSCQTQRAIPKTLGGAILFSIPASTVTELGAEHMYFGIYGQCGVGAPLISTMHPNKVPSGRFAYYSLPSSESASCNSQGYIYHVDFGLCLTQPTFLNTVCERGLGTDGTPGSYSNTTIQPCDVSNPSKAVVEQTFCSVKGMDMSTQSGMTYDCFGLSGDKDSDGWYSLEAQGSVRPVGSSNDSTSNAAFSRGGEWWLWIKNKA